MQRWHLAPQPLSKFALLSKTLPFGFFAPQKCFLLLWTSLVRLNSIWSLAFLTSSLDAQIIFLYSSHVTHSCSYPLYAALYMSKFGWELPVHRCRPSGLFAWLHTQWDGTPLKVEEMILPCLHPSAGGDSVQGQFWGFCYPFLSLSVKAGQ